MSATDRCTFRADCPSDKHADGCRSVSADARTVTDLETTALQAHADAMMALAADVHPYSGQAVRDHEKTLVAAVRELARRAEVAEADRDRWHQEALDRGRQIVALNIENAEAGVALRDAEAERDRYREALEQIAADITAYMTGDFDRYIAEAMRRRDLARAALATPDTPPDA